LRTSISYTAYDQMPLVLLHREYAYAPKKDEKDDPLRQPIDAVHPLQVSFRASARPDRGRGTGSRVLYADGERLSCNRPAQLGELIGHWSWGMRDGWAVLEHPLRREYLLYCFDTQSPPNLATYMDQHIVTLEPVWQFVPVRTGASYGYSLAITAGELCGATPQGAWVACRTQTENGVCCAVVARLRESINDANATLELNGATHTVPLQRVLVDGVGELLVATLETPGTMTDAWSASVAGIPARSGQ
jgi:hypothetical protein